MIDAIASIGWWWLLLYPLCATATHAWLSHRAVCLMSAGKVTAAEARFGCALWAVLWPLWLVFFPVGRTIELFWRVVRR